MNNRNLQSRTIKQIFIAAALLCGSFTGLGQTTVAVAPAKMNVLYIGVDNPLSVAVSSSADDNVTVAITGAGGTVAKTAAGFYNVRVNTVTDNCAVNVYVNGKLTGTSVFRVRSLPVPAAMVGGFPSGTKVSKEVLKAQPGVSVVIKDFPFDLTYNMVGFTVKLLDDANKVKEVYCEGAAFSAQARQYINEYVKPGDLVTVQNIRAKDMSGKEIRLPALVYPVE